MVYVLFNAAFMDQASPMETLQTKTPPKFKLQSHPKLTTNNSPLHTETTHTRSYYPIPHLIPPFLERELSPPFLTVSRLGRRSTGSLTCSGASIDVAPVASVCWIRLSQRGIRAHPTPSLETSTARPHKPSSRHFPPSGHRPARCRPAAQ